MGFLIPLAGILGTIAIVIAIIFVIVWFNVSVKPPHGKRTELSLPARKLIKEFEQIPKANRPYPVESLYEALIALDTKYGRDVVTKHFRKRGYESSYFSWDCDCWGGSCPCNEYLELHQAIKKLIEAAEEQKHALQMAGIASNLDRVHELTEALRSETSILRDVTKELV